MKKLLKFVLVVSLAASPLVFASGTSDEDPDPGFTLPPIVDIFA